jgi:hypothetical protein
MNTAAAQASSTNFDPSAGSYTVNTSTLTLTGPSTNITGKDVDGIAVFSFDNVSIPVGATITASGSLPLEIAATGSFDLAGTIDGSGTDAAVFTPGPNPGGPGGGQGGANDSSSGSGPGGGSPGSTDSDGGGGGGFGGAGSAGYPDGGTGGAGGPAYGDLNTALQGGSGGAGGSSGSDAAGGGGGGGGIELSGSSLTIATTGSVLANGGEGALAGDGASGGGSGGGIILHADSIDVAGTVSADGGQGGAGDCCGDGGGGGGGRIAYQYLTLTAAGSPTVTGGTSGTSDGTAHSGESPGANGVITMAKAASASTGKATSITGTAAKVHGTVKPNGYPATYQFEYGTSKSFGKKAPASPASAGSGSGAVSLSASLKHLKVGKRYHYRIVVYSLGFTITGADKTFKAKGSRPHVSTGQASTVKATQARVTGSVNAEGSRTRYYFQYYGSGGVIQATAARSAGSGSRSLSHSGGLSGLSSSTTYHYRIVAKNAFGTVRGSWRTFTTRAAGPAFTG